ncbi:MAG TPA: hypothetical protein VF881_14300 [Polyangiaceae bacterium]
MGLAVGCAGQLEDPDRFFDASPSSTGTAGGSSIDPCMANIVVTNKCATLGCHGEGAPASADLLLTASSVGANAVTFVDKSNAGFAMACMAGAYKLIDSQNPEASLILTKTKMPQPCGTLMPQLPPLLTAADTACVLSWIRSVITEKGGGSTGAGGSTGSSDGG